MDIDQLPVSSAGPGLGASEDAPTAARLPLSALASQVFVAFTIECDNEFEHQMAHRTTRFGATPGASDGPWLLSMAMWAHCLRHVPDEGIPAVELARRAGLSPSTAEMLLKRMSRWWGYLQIAPDPAAGHARTARSQWLVRPTPAGRRAREIWDPLPELITDRWRTRFGARAVDALDSALRSLVDELDMALPEFMPITTLAGDWNAHLTASHGPADAPGGEESLPASLSRLLVAFALEYERDAELSLVLGANVVRVLDDAGVPVSRLSVLTGLAGMGIENSLAALGRGGYVVVGRDPSGGRARLARLTADGLRARAAYEAGAADLEREWERRCGEAAVHAVRESLEVLVGTGSAPDCPLLAGITPYPDGWRARVAPVLTLPHYPFLAHRGGYPDGS